MKKYLIGVVTGLFCFGIFGVSSAEPVQWNTEEGGNGHYYEFIPFAEGTVSWTDARSIAESSDFLGFHGHLVTITSQAEQDFVASFVSDLRGWLGGFQDLTSQDYSEPGGGWRWVTGEAWSYTNWTVCEPNNYLGTPEHFLELRIAGDWNDTIDVGSFTEGYYVEY